MPALRPQPVLLKDYRPFPFVVSTVELQVALHEDHALVSSTLAVQRREGDGQEPLRLDGQGLELVEIRLDGQPLPPEAFSLDPEALVLRPPRPSFRLEITTRIRPQDNTSLEGLYRSHGVFCTQCEAQGFRKITFFPDRPDVLARYTTTIEADRDAYPVLLANGNLVESLVLPGGRHRATWHDPFPKPCYLFALVAGDLAVLADRFTTRSGREVTLEIYSEPHNAGRCGHAMRSLKKAMRWDEERFGLEYDLDRYLIVAVDDFNAGAMENKGLNIFNSKFILARPETATDQDYAGIESVVAHEYCHNWTGNRVTCRDWFQLSLKEGLTVFRDQEFTSDTSSRPIKRIHDVATLRSQQFPEDAGPMAHPVRPESYIEINNFYTMTVYEKGAEVIRMLHTILGEDGFKRGMRLYLDRHDGGAATTDDFVTAMEEALTETPIPGGPKDLRQFRRWYRQAGTPRLIISSDYDQNKACYRLVIRQQASPRAGEHPELLHIPVRLALLDDTGRELPLRQADGPEAPPETVLHLREAEQSYTFTGMKQRPVPSLLRGFSAPVRLEYRYEDAELRFLLLHDSDPFNRYEAGQRLFIKEILALAARGQEMVCDPALVEAAGAILRPGLHPDAAFVAQLLTLPGEEYLAELVEVIEVDALHAAREGVRQGLGRGRRQDWLATLIASRVPPPYRYDPILAGRRRLANLCLHYLLADKNDATATELALTQFKTADNMSDEVAALTALAHRGGPEAEETLAAFYGKWRHETLVVDKWLAIQATAPLPDTLARVEALIGHPAFNIKNPNKVRALMGAFAGNQVCFHAANGAGYRFLAEQVLAVDAINPHIAARLAGRFAPWRRHLPARQGLMVEEMERILAKPGLSRGVYEVIAKTLA
ncbi:MAG: aminopeptidase N [Desulfobacteraceae bacterium]|nr:aminopeptidase N [Desulfobacteraceae bacterium]